MCLFNRYIYPLLHPGHRSAQVKHLPVLDYIFLFPLFSLE